MHQHGKISSNISELEMSIFPQNIFFFLSTTKAMNERWLYTDIVSYIYLNTDIEFFFYNYFFFSNCSLREMKQSIWRRYIKSNL